MGRKKSNKKPKQQKRVVYCNRKCGEKVHVLDINAALKHELTCYECIEMAKVEQKMKITYYCLVALCMSSFCMFVMCILHPQYVEGFFQQYVDPVFYKIKHIILDLLLTPIN